MSMLSYLSSHDVWRCYVTVLFIYLLFICLWFEFLQLILQYFFLFTQLRRSHTYIRISMHYMIAAYFVHSFSEFFLSTLLTLRNK